LELCSVTLLLDGAVIVTDALPAAPEPIVTKADGLLGVRVVVPDEDPNVAVTVYVPESFAYVPPYNVTVCPAAIMYLKCRFPASSSAILVPDASYSARSEERRAGKECQ
jgi:hypothetical protein